MSYSTNIKAAMAVSAAILAIRRYNDGEATVEETHDYLKRHIQPVAHSPYDFIMGMCWGAIMCSTVLIYATFGVFTAAATLVGCSALLIGWNMLLDNLPSYSRE